MTYQARVKFWFDVPKGWVFAGVTSTAMSLDKVRFTVRPGQPNYRIYVAKTWLNDHLYLLRDQVGLRVTPSRFARRNRGRRIKIKG
jgi:hypothetical protein